MAEPESVPVAMTVLLPRDQITKLVYACCAAYCRNKDEEFLHLADNLMDQGELPAVRVELSSITCPRCGKTSHRLEDFR